MFAYVGSFTTAQRKARGDGIHVYRADPATGAWTHVQHIGELVNPSFLALSPDQRFLYSVHGDGDYASAFSLDRETGRAKLLNRAATGGKNGVRQAVDPGGKFLVVANYASGSVAVMAEIFSWISWFPGSQLKFDFYGKIVEERTLRRVASSGEDRQDEQCECEKTDQDLVAPLDGDAGFCRPHVFGS